MKALTTAGLTKLIQLIKSSFIKNTDTVTTQTVTLADVATSGDYDDLINKPTIPTATSDLTNDSGFITNSDLPTVDQTFNGTSTNAQSGVAINGAGFALNNNVVHLTGNETINGRKSFNNVVYTKGLYSFEGTHIGSYNDLSYRVEIGDINYPVWLCGSSTRPYYKEGINNEEPLALLTDIPTNTSDLTNDSGYITGITSSDVITALTYTPYNGATNPNGYITGITSSDVTTALGYTPYNSTNPSGYTSNVGTVTSVNNTQPDANGNVSLSIPTAISDLTDDTSTTPIDKADTLTGLTASVSELNYTDGVTSNIQTQLNNKSDTDLSNITDSSYIKMSGAGMAGDRYIDLTLNVSGSSYTAPANGWFVCGKTTNGANQYIAITNSRLSATASNASSGGNLRIYIPVTKGDNITVNYSAGGALLVFRFYYAQGSESEAS